MNAVLTEDGKIAIPPELREDAQLKPGDTLDVQLYKGTLVLRKRQPLTREECAALLERTDRAAASPPLAGHGFVSAMNRTSR